MTEEERLFLIDLKSNTQKLFQQITGLESENKQLEKQGEEIKELKAAIQLLLEKK